MRGVFYLASTSPRRREILQRAGLAFELHPPGPEPAGSGSPEQRAVQRARSKATAAPPAPGPVLGVDTVVVLSRSAAEPLAIGDGAELGKPADRAAAAAMLARLAGRDHVVLTAHCLYDHRRGVMAEACARSRVRCEALTDAQIEAYLEGGDWTDKAGAYGIQGAAGAFMQLVEGDLDTVIGLHLATVRRLLAEVA